MTIMTTTSMVSEPGDGQKTIFKFGFIIPENMIEVYLTENGIEKSVSQQDYGVSGFDNKDGGTVTFYVAPTASQIVTIRRVVEPTQSKSLKPAISSYLETVEGVLDHHAMVMQQLQSDMGRAVKAPLGSGQKPELLFDNIEEAVSEAKAAQKAAELAKDGAVEAKKGAVIAQELAEKASQDAGVAKDAAVGAKNDAEAAKGAAEMASQVAIDAKESAETAVANAKLSEEHAAQSASDAAKISEKLDDVTTSGGLVPAGAVMPFANTNVPSGWMLCDGAEVNREEFADLYAAIGDSYGAGNGSTTFNLPKTNDTSFGENILIDAAALAASSTYGSYVVSRLLDAAAYTEWASAAVGVPATITYAHKEAQSITKYSLSYAVTPYIGSYGFSPDSWVLEGSNDGANWVVLDTQSGQIWTKDQTRDYYPTNRTPFRYHRLGDMRAKNCSQVAFNGFAAYSADSAFRNCIKVM